MPPRRPSPYSHYRAPEDDLRGRLGLCAIIAVVTVGFFWTYDLAIHRDPIFVPSLNGQTGTSLANMDLGVAPGTASQASLLASATADLEPVRIAPVNEKALEGPITKPKSKNVVHHLSREAADAFASGAHATYSKPEIGAPF